MGKRIIYRALLSDVGIGHLQDGRLGQGCCGDRPMVERFTRLGHNLKKKMLKKGPPTAGLAGRDWARWRRSASGVVAEGRAREQQLASIFAQQQFELAERFRELEDRRGGCPFGAAAASSTWHATQAFRPSLPSPLWAGGLRRRANRITLLAHAVQ